MVLVDTSVWIRSLAGRQPFRAAVDQLLRDESVLAHDLVFGELLIGDAGGRTVALTYYGRFSYATAIPHADVVTFVRERRLFGRGIGWIDAHLLASSLVSGARLYTADSHLALVADELDIAYIPD
jgi:predicted nucleic acid-binding protein